MRFCVFFSLHSFIVLVSFCFFFSLSLSLSVFLFLFSFILFSSETKQKLREKSSKIACLASLGLTHSNSNYISFGFRRTRNQNAKETTKNVKTIPSSHLEILDATLDQKKRTQYFCVLCDFFSFTSKHETQKARTVILTVR